MSNPTESSTDLRSEILRLVEKNYSWLLRVARRRLMQHGVDTVLCSEEDLVNSVFHSVWASELPECSPDGVRALFFHRIRRKANKKLCEQLTYKRGGHTTTSRDVELDHLVSGDNEALTRDLLMDLPPNSQELAHFLLKGHTQREIASLLKTSTGTIQRKVSRLRAELADWNPPTPEEGEAVEREVDQILNGLDNTDRNILGHILSDSDQETTASTLGLQIHELCMHVDLLRAKVATADE